MLEIDVYQNLRTTYTLSRLIERELVVPFFVFVISMFIQLLTPFFSLTVYIYKI